MGRLAGGVAHDFNNLLTAIMGYADLTAATLPSMSRARDDLHIEEIKEAARAPRDLTRQLLAFSRRQVSRPRVLDLNQLVRARASCSAAHRRGRRARDLPPSPDAHARQGAADAGADRAGADEPRGQRARRHAERRAR
jgi:signal transduction histidine kinase